MSSGGGEGVIGICIKNVVTVIFHKRNYYTNFFSKVGGGEPSVQNWKYTLYNKTIVSLGIFVEQIIYSYIVYRYFFYIWIVFWKTGVQPEVRGVIGFRGRVYLETRRKNEVWNTKKY